MVMKAMRKVMTDSWMLLMARTSLEDPVKRTTMQLNGLKALLSQLAIITVPLVRLDTASGMKHHFFLRFPNCTLSTT
jgi:hypothetical protein